MIRLWHHQYNKAPNLEATHPRKAAQRRAGPGRGETLLGEEALGPSHWSWLALPVVATGFLAPST